MFNSRQAVSSHQKRHCKFLERKRGRPKGEIKILKEPQGPSNPKVSDNLRSRAFTLFKQNLITFDEMEDLLKNAVTEVVLKPYPESISVSQLVMFKSVANLTNSLIDVFGGVFEFDKEQNILHYIDPETNLQTKISLQDNS